MSMLGNLRFACKAAAKAASIASAQIADEILKSDFLPAEGTENKEKERWLKISYAHLSIKNFLMAAPFPSMLIEIIEIVETLGGNLTQNSEIAIFKTASEISSIVLEKHLHNGGYNAASLLSEQQKKLENYIANHDEKWIEEKLSSGYNLSEIQLKAFLVISQKYFKFMQEIYANNCQFIEQCNKNHVNEKMIVDCSKRYEWILQTRIESYAREIVFGTRSPLTPDLPPIPDPPADVDADIEVEAAISCCDGILHAFKKGKNLPVEQKGPEYSEGNELKDDIEGQVFKNK